MKTIQIELPPHYPLVKMEDELLQLFQFLHREWEYSMEMVSKQQPPINMHLILIHMYINI